MKNSKEEYKKKLLSVIPHLTERQIYRIAEMAEVLSDDHEFTRNNQVPANKTIFNEVSFQDFGDFLRLHHGFSEEPFTKDKFEYVMKSVLTESGCKVVKPTTNNPGEDLIINQKKFSLKTQADQSIKKDELQIHKFMELGRGDWTDKPEDYIALRKQFLSHLGRYDRIIVLRAFENPKVCNKGGREFTHWVYELVEIPKKLLLEADEGEIEISTRSKAKTAKPATCHIRDKAGNIKYQLYFDGAGERKLKITKLNKKYCRVHGQWKFPSRLP